MKIAIIGTGISGLTAGYLLNRHHDLTVYEANRTIGGHTATVDVDTGGRPLAVDTGFIVFNDRTYPNFIKLIDRLEVESQPTEMGFSVTTRHRDDIDLEYCGSDFSGLFCNPAQVANPRFLGMLHDINRFNRRATRDLETGNIPPSLSLEAYLDRSKYGRYFRDYYIYPMASAIWSAPVTRVPQFDALFFVRFFLNHGLLQIRNRPQWRVIRGGSRCYLPPLVRTFENRIRTANRVNSVRRHASGVTVSCDRGDAEFDQVIFACHSDQALRLLCDADSREQALLGAIPYRNNSVVLHTDTGLLPKRRKAWASWNYLLDGFEHQQPVLTYNMNILQGLPSEQTVCVSVNADRHIDESTVLRKFEYAHPQFDRNSVDAQQCWGDINGVNRTWYCGAYWGNGFHEDGVVSGQRVAAELGGDLL